MAKLKTRTVPDTPQGMSLSTIAGTYEAARAVLRVIPADQISTTDQMVRHLKTLLLPRNREQVFHLLQELIRLDDHSRVLGLTTLVAPVDHPLVLRHTLPREREG